MRADRKYEDVREFEKNCRPDEATIWAFSALLDPEGGEKSHTLGLPIMSTLLHLTCDPTSDHPDQPLVGLPKLYRTLQPNSLRLLTTLTLDAMNALINDSTVLALKWCTHLTALWLKGCQVTDIGIRLLASALVLPGDGTSGQVEGRGMWRFRAWFLRGCTGVTDRSMKPIARWPGLTLLGDVPSSSYAITLICSDVRDTSCTEASMSIFNRSSQALFSCANADFQPCTPGLLPLFATKSPPSEIIDNLCRTLLAPTMTTSTLGHIALHIVPSKRPIPPEQLPDPQPGRQKRYTPVPEGSHPNAVYRGGGIGQIYGTDVTKVHDEVQAKRADVPIALMLPADEEEDRREAAGLRRKRGMKWWESDTPVKRYVGKVYKDTKGRGNSADERSKAFVKGGIRGKGSANGKRSGPGSEAEEVEGARSLMMVRMIAGGWERLSWASGPSLAVANLDSGGSSSQVFAATQRTNRDDLVGPIMAATKPASTPAGPFRPVDRAVVSSFAFSPSTRVSQNPFHQPPSSASRPLASQGGGRPLFSSGIGLKRTFDGGATQEDMRRGLKMFSGGRK